VQSLGRRLLKDNVKFVSSKVTANNYATSKKQFETIFDICEKNGYLVPESEQRQILEELKQSFEEAVRKQWHREEQTRIKRQIREEEKLESERQRELQRLENEEIAVQTTLQKALQRAKDEHDTEVERLKHLLEEAQAKLQRAKSMAELTKAGFIYVISNIGSLGENVFKVGMTRRLEPLDRVRELGDASVPFPFDVHMMISSDNAPALENTLHQELHKHQVNKVNPRKEFYKVDIDTIVRLVEKNYGKIEYVAMPEALEYNESLNMSNEDFDYVAQELKQFEEDEEGYHPSDSSQQLGIKQTHAEISEVHQDEEAEKILDKNWPTGIQTPKDDIYNNSQSDKQTKKERRTVSCPNCKGSIFVDTLTFGENSCPHCKKIFKVRGSKNSGT
jgi:hypothetical protein